MNGTYGGRGSLRSLLLVLVAPASVMAEKCFLGNGSKNNLLHPALWDTTGCFIVYTIFGWVSRIQRLHCDP